MVGIFGDFFWSPSPMKRSAKNPRKIRGKFRAKFGTKYRKNRETFVLQLSWPNRVRHFQAKSGSLGASRARSRVGLRQTIRQHQVLSDNFGTIIGISSAIYRSSRALRARDPPKSLKKRLPSCDRPGQLQWPWTPDLENSRKRYRVQSAGKQPKFKAAGQPAKQPKNLLASAGFPAVFRRFLRHFNQGPLGSFFSCSPGCFQGPALGASVAGWGDRNSRGCPPPRIWKSLEESFRTFTKLFPDSCDFFEICSRLLGVPRAEVPGRLYENFSGLRARRARETPVNGRRVPNKIARRAREMADGFPTESLEWAMFWHPQPVQLD